METIIVRLELDPLDANLLAGLVEEYVSSRVQRLVGGPVPVHTRSRLEEQRERAEAIDRALTSAIANPVLVEIPDPAE